jgi:hypothetical protein
VTSIRSGAARSNIGLGRATGSHSTTLSSANSIVVDTTVLPTSHAATSASAAERLVDLLASSSSSASSIGSGRTYSIVDLGRITDSHSATLSSANKTVLNTAARPASYAATSASAVERLVDLLTSPESHSAAVTTSNHREIAANRGTDSVAVPLTTDVSVVVHRVVSAESHSATNVSSSMRVISLRKRASSHSSSISAAAESLIDVNVFSSSYGNARSFVYTDATSLELVNYNISWDDDESVWYTDWYSESKILGSEDDLAIRSLIVDDAKDPAATVVLQYSHDGSEVDHESEPIALQSDERVYEIDGVPVDEDGKYRLKIMEYSGYNSIYAINTAIVN